jgi:dipeptidase
MLDIYEWDTGKYLGKIKQVPVTYNVVGNINEHQVAIGETTYGGRKELQEQKDAKVDYGALMYVTLQRAKTAREAIRIIGRLMDEYGYYSSGEMFSVSDPKEVWIMAIIGKGPGEKGAVWVARRVPDGYVSAHANHARIRTFPLNDPENCLYVKDVISFARKKGWFDGKDEEFSFQDVYSPLSWKTARFCEARVWSFFRRVAPSLNLQWDPVKGGVVDGKTGELIDLPLWVKPDRKLTVKDLMNLMRDHFEDSPLDLTKGVGAGPFELPYRWRGLTWKVNDVEYINERATATQQTGFSFVAQSREGMPGPIGGVLWFGLDDASSTVYMPMYAGIRNAPYNLAVGTGDFYNFTWDSGFWVFNAVANQAYRRYKDMIEDIRVEQRKLEGAFLGRQPEIEKTALTLWKQDPGMARDYLTEYSTKQAERTVGRWRDLWQELFLRYLDGNVRDELGKVTHPGYPEHWYRRIVEEDAEVLKSRKFDWEPEEEEDH